MSSKDRLPVFTRWLLRKFCNRDYQEEVAGDLEENYRWRLQKKGAFQARFRYYLDVFSAIRFYRAPKSQHQPSSIMFLSFFKSSLRNLQGHKTYTVLNLFGLVTGLMVALFILEYLSHELNYNRSERSEHIYRVSNDYYRFGKMVYVSSQTFPAVGPGMVAELPAVTHQARLYNAEMGWGGATILTHPDQPRLKFREKHVYFTDPSMVHFFDLEVEWGQGALEDPNTVILSRSLAEKYFGSAEAAIGQTLKYNDDMSRLLLTVTGVYQKPDFNLQVDLDALISYTTLSSLNPDRFEHNWRTNSVMTFVEIQPGTEVEQLTQDLEALSLSHKPDYEEKNEQGEYNRVNHFHIMPITDIHLHSEFQNELGPVGSANTVDLLKLIAVLIVVIAWINFINLSTARSITRAREVAVRKVIGANRSHLVIQFFAEALIMNLTALVLAMGLVLVMQPAYNGLVELPLHLSGIDLQRFGQLAVLTFFLGAFFSGIYPALVLANFPAFATLKNSQSTQKGGILRKGLIAFQLLSSMLLIMATLSIHAQLKFMNSQDLGFEPSQVLILKGPTIREGDREANLRQLNLFKQQLAEIPGVERVGSAGTIPGVGILRGIVLTRVKDDGNLSSIERLVVDDHFLSSLNMCFIAGGDFHLSPNEENPIILTNAAVQALGFESAEEAIGLTIFEFAAEPRKIVGVIDDFHQESLKTAKDPMYFIRNNRVNTYLSARLTTDELRGALQSIETRYEELFPGNPMEFYFLDDYFQQQYAQNELMGRVFSAFALVAILVAALGLFGLSAYSSLKRTKEVGIRKVLGASVANLFLLLSKETWVLVSITFLLTLPIGFYGVDLWLSGFAYRMPIKGWLFALPLAAVLIICLSATANRILKVALDNPVNSLRQE